ncbi:RNA exonuclease Ecym_4619 [Eremothecium cymbalariae DBVPG|uniref:Endonuclease/exonuclease/phosphatase domain-containing protein n=1 Tax=Eremothecium cymbalariae (strain CBS 270.75 / DBVPG 7215 / KCTC 17166 / NRRL Y-17582) TaxID=931890 RepID=G8JSC6_ERECY|nr:hypothetical protein Ecym_4619 [Eremothecium cymbalariae DBVPG\
MMQSPIISDEGGRLVNSMEQVEFKDGVVSTSVNFTDAPDGTEETARSGGQAATESNDQQMAPNITSLNLEFIARPMLPLKVTQTVHKGFSFSLMTYNCLAQSLIRRSLFPTSGRALKWTKRSMVLLKEFKHYNADVLCLQEIDYTQYYSFWMNRLSNLGYGSRFHRMDNKSHGVAIFWKKDLFIWMDQMLINFDNEDSGEIEPRKTTNNVGMILALGFSDKVKQSFPGTVKSGIIVGTSHLFWHPFGTYERTRQCYVILNKMKEFIHRVHLSQNEHHTDLTKWYPFFCGDFNSQPFDAPYLSITSKPVLYSGRAKTVIECSAAYKFPDLGAGARGANEDGGTVGEDRPVDPVPESFQPTAEVSSLVQKMEKLHNSLDMRAISLYAVAYKHVHPDNAGLDNERGEPEISNWAYTWRGLLDYIMYITPWQASNNVEVDSLESFEKLSHITVQEMLRMPPAKEMSSHGQPHDGEYPSDHLAMMCKLEVEM